MLLVNVEGKLIDNIIIFKNELYFSDIDPDPTDGEAIYTNVPVNEYMFNTDSFNTVQVFLFHENYLGFCYTSNLDKFKNKCLKQFEEKNTSFKYNGLSVILEKVKDPEYIKIER